VSVMDRIKANPLPLFQTACAPDGIGRVHRDGDRGRERARQGLQISRGPNDEYIVSFEGYTFVIPADKALPSNDPCSHIFFPNMWVETDDGDQVRDPGTPNIRCFLTPLDF
jgi:hypothetical protein